MPKNPSSQKRQLIDKANQRVVVTTSIAAFVVVFCLVAGHALFGQMLYQNRIVSAKKKALTQLKADQSAANNLETSYKAFVATSQNVLGGDPNGTGGQDGDNGKIVLDALPSQYDFPALASSLEKLVNSQGLAIQSISGTDDEVNQSSQQASANPQPIAMPFQLSVTGNFQSIENLSATFEKSIRPIQIQTMTLSGSDATLNLAISAQTFYQPQKTFNVTKQVIK